VAIENFESSPLNKISPFNRQNLKLKGFKIPHNLVFSLKKKTTSIKCVYNKKNKYALYQDFEKLPLSFSWENNMCPKMYKLLAYFSFL